MSEPNNTFPFSGMEAGGTLDISAIFGDSAPDGDVNPFAMPVAAGPIETAPAAPEPAPAADSEPAEEPEPAVEEEPVAEAEKEQPSVTPAPEPQPQPWLIPKKAIGMEPCIECRDIKKNGVTRSVSLK